MSIIGLNPEYKRLMAYSKTHFTKWVFSLQEKLLSRIEHLILIFEFIVVYNLKQ